MISRTGLKKGLPKGSPLILPVTESAAGRSIFGVFTQREKREKEDREKGKAEAEAGCFIEPFGAVHASMNKEAV